MTRSRIVGALAVTAVLALIADDRRNERAWKREKQRRDAARYIHDHNDSLRGER